jgi:hypothetical protein
MPRKKQTDPEQLEGRVIAKTVLRGTASEHTGVVLETPAGEHLRLQRVGGNPFADPVTRGLVGRVVSVKGVRLGDIFRFTDYDVA